jgi:hypothetical protein
MWEYKQTAQSDYLAHYGVMGMRWGVRRYQNKDGSLTPAGNKHVGDYRKSRSMMTKVEQEGAKLIRFDKRLKDQVPDQYHDLNARAEELGVNTKRLRSAIVGAADFYKDNKQSIETGRKIVSKLLKESANNTEVAVNQTGSYEEHMRRR